MKHIRGAFTTSKQGTDICVHTQNDILKPNKYPIKHIKGQVRYNAAKMIGKKKGNLESFLVVLIQLVYLYFMFL